MYFDDCHPLSFVFPGELSVGDMILASKIGGFCGYMRFFAGNRSIANFPFYPGQCRFRPYPATSEIVPYLQVIGVWIPR